MSQIKPQSRVDHWLKARYPSLSGRHIEEAIKAGLVRTKDWKKTKKGQDVDGELDCSALETHLEILKKGNADLSIPILHEEKDWLVVDKPAGVPSHPIGLFDRETVTQWAFAKYPKVSEEFLEVQPTLCPHRLDIGTSGLLIVAKTKKSFEDWRGRFEEKRIEKKYWALCWGNPIENTWTIEDPIAHAMGSPGSMVVVNDPKIKFRDPVQKAVSEIKVLEKYPDKGLVLLEVTAKTGVTHQVRVHLASAGFPLLGDLQYDESFQDRVLKPKFHQLRAVELSYNGKTFKVLQQKVALDSFQFLTE